MIDLDILMENTIDFKINGEFVKVQEPSMAMVKKFAKLDGLTTDEILDKQTELIVEILNNNTSARKFTANEIEKLPSKVIKVIINEIMKSIQITENNPN